MDDSTARELIALNNDFYRAHAASFSATRQAPWPGWRRVAETARDLLEGGAPTVLDVACGNLRFERFLADALPRAHTTVYAVDDCADLAADTARAGLPAHSVRYRQEDVLGTLLSGREALCGIPACDLVACFGFMHHVPGARLRFLMLDALAAHLAPGGALAVSFWRFMDDARLAAKTGRADALAAARGMDPQRLDAGDHFLGWQDDPSALRYCHHFPEEELDSLSRHLESRGLREVDRFSADGKSGSLNRYLVFRRDA